MDDSRFSYYSNLVNFIYYVDCLMFFVPKLNFFEFSLVHVFLNNSLCIKQEHEVILHNHN